MTSTSIAPVSTDVVDARDAAVRACLKHGRASFDELLAAMPVEAGLSDEDRRVALQRSLGRLRMKTREVKTNGATWELNV